VAEGSGRLTGHGFEDEQGGFQWQMSKLFQPEK
jgi:hypothetical protein